MKYGAEAGLLTERRGAGTFHIKFFQNLSFLHSEITLPLAKLCYAFEENIVFFATIILWKKGDSKLSKKEPENMP